MVGRVQTALEQADYSSEMKGTADYLRVIHAEYFADETGPSGEKWTPWYFKRPGASADHKTLDDTGRLKESVIGTSSEHIEDISAKSLIWGTSVPYAWQHEIGGKFTVEEFLIGKRGQTKHPGDTINLPKREFIGINTDHVDAIVGTIADAAQAVVLDAIDGKGL